MPDEVKPNRVAGLGIHVSDLERSKRFYTDALGLKVDARVPPQGAPVDYLPGFDRQRVRGHADRHSPRRNQA